MPGEKVTLVTSDTITNTVFDSVVKLPYGDVTGDVQWKLENDWQVYWASPYDYTIKLEADMYIPCSIDYWWDILKQHELVISTTIRNRYNQISDERYYRKIFYDNNLPDVYNAITYFKKCSASQYFFELVRNIFENWTIYRNWIRCSESESATTDVVYAIAASIIGAENCTLPSFTDMSMIHMKPIINRCKNLDWTQEYIYEIHPDAIRIETVPQLYPFHYHVKHFAQTIKEELNGS
jgi:hypothetical protein